MPAKPHPLPSPPTPALQAALDEVLRAGLVVMRMAEHLAQVETVALDALAEQIAETARATAAPASLEDAIVAGRNADASDTLRDAFAARAASITQCYEKAARAVRRTVALHMRLAAWRSRDPAAPSPALRTVPGPVRRPANDTDPAERPDAPEHGDDPGDELGTMSNEAALQAIRQDLAEAMSGLPPPLPDTTGNPPRPGPAVTWRRDPPASPPPLPPPDT